MTLGKCYMHFRYLKEKWLMRLRTMKGVLQAELHVNNDEKKNEEFKCFGDNTK